MTRKFSLFETTMLSWAVGFVMMWLVTWNLSVLPLSILLFAIPLSVLKCFLAAYICQRMAP